MTDESKPRIRVKARRASTIRFGGVAVAINGYDKVAQCAFGEVFRKHKNVYAIKRLARCGDYDKYLVIHD